MKTEPKSERTEALVVCEEGKIHFPGNGYADTATLCGFAWAKMEETRRKTITCPACSAIVKQVEQYLKATQTNP